MTDTEIAAADDGGTRSPRVRQVLAITGVTLTAVVAWELYKVVGTALDGTWPFVNVDLPVKPNNSTLPHVWDIVGRLFEPAQRRGDLLIVLLLKASLFTLREALIGFGIGAVVGFGLGVWFVRSTLAERAFMPYVVASQTVPILAIAPMVVVWGNQLGIGQLLRVAIIAAYITFFPVAINTLRGLRSPQRTATELMRSYAASKNQTLWKLQVPSALPYIFTALKVAATASVIGAIIGELPTGSRDGLGRALLQFSQQFGAAPEKLYAAVLISALTGMVAVAVVTFFEHRYVDAVRRVPA